MSNHRQSDPPSKIRALEEVVCLLKKHIQQREVEIKSLGKQYIKSNDRIKSLEKKVDEKNMDEYRIKGLRQDKEELFKKLKAMQTERDNLNFKLETTTREKESALINNRKIHEDLKSEKKIQSSVKHGMMSYGVNKELHDRVTELEYLNRSSAGELERAENELDSLKRDTLSMRMSNEKVVEDLKVDNSNMREKLNRMHELSAENLLLQSDSADFQAELTELRDEAKDLRSRCYGLTEENRQYKAEIRDLRRFIDLLKANKPGDCRQDLLNKIEYYQMEHDRLMDEVRRLKQRLGDISPPRSPRSPTSYKNSYGGEIGRRDERIGRESSKINSSSTVRFSSSLERGRSPVGDCMAASSATSNAASRILKDGRSLSPSAALNIRDLTMERYDHHMVQEINRPCSPDSTDSDATELLLKPQTHMNGHAERSRNYSDDDDEVELNLLATRNDSSGSGGGCRSTNGDSMTRSFQHKRSQSPINSAGFRSLSPKMTSTINNVQPTARDRYSTNIKRSLPRRAFAPRSPADLVLGYCIKFTRPGGKLSRGTIRYIGHLPNRDDIFIGVELDGYDGKHAGTFQGKKYFTCPQNKGIFTPFGKVIMAWE